MNYNLDLIKEQILKTDNARVLFDEPMSKHTSFKIGGQADIFVTAENENALAEIIKLCNNASVPLTVLGNGSNMLVSDGGIRGVVLSLGGELKKIEVTDGAKLLCGAGAMLVKVCLTALENSLTGLEFAYGIPGSVGGGAFMNAGAYGGEMKDCLVECRHIDKSGNIGILKAEDMELAYRHSAYSANGCVITSVLLQLEKGNSADIRAKMDDLMGRRKDKQPVEYPSAGSVFKRPEGYFAGTLIEQSGLKGYTIGGAQVSEKHAGFIINRGGATCDDVLRLVEHIQNTVFKNFGVNLECEIRKIG